MRSGTSAVAQMVHRMGVCAAMTMTPPQPPRWHADWEDCEALAHLMRLWPLGTPVDRDVRAHFQFWFAAYLKLRMQHRDLLGAPWLPGIACKSPLYAPFLIAIGYEAEMAGLALKVIVCERDAEDSRASILQSQPKFLWDSVLATQAEIHKALNAPIPGALIVPFDGLVSEPHWQACRIAEFLGVEDQGAARAIDTRAVAGGV